MQYSVTINVIWILVWVWGPIVIWEYDVIPHKESFGSALIVTAAVMIISMWVVLWQEETVDYDRFSNQDDLYEEE